MKNVVAVSRYIDSLMHTYLAAVFIMCTDDTRQRIFLIVHSLNKKIKDVDAVFRYIDFLLYTYLVAAFIMCTDDVRRRPFAYKFGVFFLIILTLVM